jgi:hypothetical protein
MTLSELLIIYDDVYKNLALNFALARRQPEQSDYHYKNAIIVLMDAPTDIKLILQYELIYPVFDVYRRSIQDSVNNKAFVTTANEIINNYVIRSGVDLTDFVNNVSWDTDIPFDWVMLSKEAGFDTTNWNAEFGDYVVECDPYLWINDTPPYINASVRCHKIQQSSVNINGVYRLNQDGSNPNKFIYNDGQVIIEYEVT